MPYIIEKVFTSYARDFSPASNNLNVEACAFDGRYLWVTQPTGGTAGTVFVLEYFGERTGHEPSFDEMDALEYSRIESGNNRKMRIVATLTVTATTYAKVTSQRSLCEYPEYFDSAAGTYTPVSGTTVTVSVNTTLGNDEKYVSVSKTLTDGTLPLNPYFIQYSNGKMYVTSGTSNWQNVFEFDAMQMKYLRMIAVGSSVDSVAKTVKAVGGSGPAASGYVTRDQAGAIATTNITGIGGGGFSTRTFTSVSEIDPSSGYGTFQGTRFLLTGQTVASENGLWQGTVSGKLMRMTASIVYCYTAAADTARSVHGWWTATNNIWTQHSYVPGNAVATGNYGTGTQVPLDIYDGVVIVQGDKVLSSSAVVVAPNVTGTGGITNGVNVFYGATSVSSEFDTDAENTNASVIVQQGNTYAGTIWYRSSPATSWTQSAPTQNSNDDIAGNMIVAHGKIWGVRKMVSTNVEQKLVSYDIASNVRTFITLPVRPSAASSWIANGYNGALYITNYNNFSITKVNAETGVVENVIRLNSSPVRIWSDAARRIWVSSYAGMLSLIDYTDDSVQNDWGSENNILHLAADPTDASKLWWLDNTGKLVRYDIVTKQMLETENTSSDWALTSKELSVIQNGGFVFITPFATYNKDPDSTVTVRPYVFSETFISGTNFPMFCFRLDDTYLYRDAVCEVNAQGAIVDGTQEYFGE